MFLNVDPVGLPRGRHGLDQAFVVSNQRARILDAFAESVAAKGYSPVTVSEVIERAGVSRKTFYEQFRDKQACFAASYEAGLSVLTGRIAEVYRAHPEPSPARARAVLGTLLDVLAAEPAFARMSMVEVFAAGPEAIARHTEVIDSFVPLLAVAGDYESARAHGQSVPEPVVLRAVVGGITSVIHRHILAGRTRALPELLDPLTRFLLAPFLDEGQVADVAGGAGRDNDA
ncbi:MAG: TetR/AcrR family transcriptional regulator [Trebonia sp.]